MNLRCFSGGPLQKNNTPFAIYGHGSLNRNPDFGQRVLTTWENIPIDIRERNCCNMQQNGAHNVNGTKVCPSSENIWPRLHDLGLRQSRDPQNDAFIGLLHTTSKRAQELPNVKDTPQGFMTVPNSKGERVLKPRKCGFLVGFRLKPTQKRIKIHSENTSTRRRTQPRPAQAAHGLASNKGSPTKMIVSSCFPLKPPKRAYQRNRNLRQHI